MARLLRIYIDLLFTFLKDEFSKKMKKTAMIQKSAKSETKSEQVVSEIDKEPKRFRTPPLLLKELLNLNQYTLPKDLKEILKLEENTLKYGLK